MNPLAFTVSLVLLASSLQATNASSPAHWSPTRPRALPMSASERSNLTRVTDWWRLVIEAGHLEFVPQFQAPGYIQHNPGISTGRDGFLAAFRVDNHPTNPIPAKLTERVPLAGSRGDYVW